MLPAAGELPSTADAQVLTELQCCAEISHVISVVVFLYDGQDDADHIPSIVRHMHCCWLG